MIAALPPRPIEVGVAAIWMKLSDHFNYVKLLRYTAPTIGVVVVMSIYGMVDGFFVSNFVGTEAFAAINLAMPPIILLSFVGFLFGTGGSALIGKTLGEGKKNKANRIFSMLVYLSIVLNIVLEILGLMYIGDVAELLGAEDELLELCTTYGRIILLALPLNSLQFEFQYLAPTAEKPNLGFLVTATSGLMNIVLDALFIIVFGWGLEGAAIATAISQAVGGILPLIYFSRKNSSLLQLTKTNLDLEALFQTCTNGASELLSNISMSIVGMLYNWQLLNYAGSKGVAAFGILMYVTFIFESVFIGYSVGSAPIVSYNFGARNYSELKSLLKKSLIIVGVFSTLMFLCSEILARPLSRIYASGDENLLEMTVHAFRLYSFTFLLAGFTVFISAFFTALNNGLISALISGLRTLVFEVIAILLLPKIFGLDGVWLATVSADLIALFISVYMLVRHRKRYRYY